MGKLKRFLKPGVRLSMGEQCKNFESDLCFWQGREYATLVNSGSSANLALIQSLLNLGRLKPGDRVGFSALTWATNVMPIIQLGLIPVPIDVEIETLNVSSRLLEKAGDMECLFITNLLGLCDNLADIVEHCQLNDILLIEDNCESMGSVYKGIKLGNFGLASTFSFYVGHHLSTIEGGAVMTDDDELADMLKMVRAHGWRRDTGDNLDFYGRYTFYDLGYNLRPTEITGFIGTNSINNMGKITHDRERNAKYFQSLYDNDFAYPYFIDHMDIFSSFSTPIVYRLEEDRNKAVELCNERGIECRPIVGGNITQQPFFKKYFGETRLKNAEIIHKNGLYVANNPQLGSVEKQAIKKALCLK